MTKFTKREKVMAYALASIMMVEIIVLLIAFGSASAFGSALFPLKSQEVNDSIYEMGAAQIIRTTTPENFTWSFSIGEKIYGVNLVNDSNIFLAGGGIDTNAILYTGLILNQYYANLTEQSLVPYVGADKNMDLNGKNLTNVNNLGIVSTQINPQGQTRPDCNEANRGLIWDGFGALGVADNLTICKKTALDIYNWTPIV